MSKKSSQKTSNIDNQKALEDKVKGLEDKIEFLEKNTKEAKMKKRLSNIKKFFVKHKLLVITSLVILVIFVSWEIFSLYSYRNYLHSAFSAQQDGRFEEAANDLVKVKQVTHRSPTLYILRRESVEELVRTNDLYVELNSKDTELSQVEEENESMQDSETEQEETSIDIESKETPVAETNSPDDSVVTPSLPEQKETWLVPASSSASGYTVWGGEWYTGPPSFAIDDKDFTSWTLEDLGYITVDIGSIKKIKSVQISVHGSVSSGNVGSIFVDGKKVVNEEVFGSQEIKSFTPVEGRYVKYQTLPLPHNKYGHIATWSEVSDFKVLVVE